MIARPFQLGAFLLALVGVAPRHAAAQVSETTDIITGTVRDPSGQPLQGALVTVTSLETQVTRERRTGSDGRFTIVFPDGGGRYQLLARFVGMTQARVTVARQADEDRLVADIQMGPESPIVLEPMTVTARRPNRAGGAGAARGRAKIADGEAARLRHPRLEGRGAGDAAYDERRNPPDRPAAVLARQRAGQTGE